MLVHAPTEPGRPITEDSPLDPKWDYPKSKVRTEELIRRERGDIPVVLLRIAGVYNDRCDSIPLAHQIQRIYEKQLTSHVYPADTARGQAFVHLDDLVDAFVRVIERRTELPPETVLLIGEPETLELRGAAGDVRPADPRRGVEHVPDPGGGGQGRGVGAGQPAVRPGAVHQAVDDRPGGRPLRTGHHPGPTAARVGAEALAARRRCRRWSRR